MPNINTSGFFEGLDTSGCSINPYTWTSTGSSYSNSTYSSSTNDTYIEDFFECLSTKKDIDTILNFPLEDLPLHLNDSFTKTAKKILDLRLKANI